MLIIIIATELLLLLTAKPFIALIICQALFKALP